MSPDAAALDPSVVETQERELAALVILVRAAPVPVDHIAELAEEIGSAVELLRAFDAGAFAHSAGELALSTGPALESQLPRVVEEVRAWARAGLDVRTVFEEEYPANLRDVGNRPPFVFVRGGWDDVRDSRAIAVVGTRRASPVGLERAATIAQRLAEAGVTVLSGLAAGIDAAAHRGALAVGGRTSAVIGTGITRPTYPAENADLARAIVERGAGALLSQFLPDQPPTKWTFPKRNVVMSGLSWATVVVEASVTSGARVQAKEALKHGRTVFLLKSLVEEHPWAHRFVTEGVEGVRAIQVGSVNALLERITAEVFSIPVR